MDCPFRARPATAVVFGLAGVEDRLYGLYRQQLEDVVAAMGIEKVLDVGPRLSSAPGILAGVPVISKGVLPATQYPRYYTMPDSVLSPIQ